MLNMDAVACTAFAIPFVYRYLLLKQARDAYGSALLGVSVGLFITFIAGVV